MDRRSWAQVGRRAARLAESVTPGDIEQRVGFKVELGRWLQPRMSISNFNEIDGIKDDLENLYTWLWNTKDYLAELLVDRGTTRPTSKRMVNDYVNQHRPLRVVADVANTAKHAVLTHSRSGLHARMGGYTTTMPLFLKPLSLKATEAEVKRRSSSYISLVDADGKSIGDAVVVASEALGLWQAFVDQHRLGASTHASVS